MIDSAAALKAVLVLLLSPLADPHNELPTATEMECLAKTVYFEARGEEIEGQLAVASVVLNRQASAKYPDTICEVVKQQRKPGKYHCQFTWWCDGKSDKIADDDEDYNAAYMISIIAIANGYDSNGSTHYHADSVDPYWSDTLTRVSVIGDHVFYRNPEY